MKILDAALKEKIKQLATEFFNHSSAESVDISRFREDVLSKIPDFNYKEYVPSAQAALLSFFQLMPDVFFLESRNNGTAWFCSLTVNKFKKIFRELVGDNGRCFIATVPKSISSGYGLDYKEYSNGKKLKPWIKASFSDEFQVSADDKYLIRIAEGNILLGSSINENSQFHMLTTTPDWGNFSKILEKYSKKENENWSNIISKGFSQSLIGEGGLFYYTVNGITKIVFDTTVRTEDENIVYCVLKENQKDTVASLKPFSLEGFCCALEDETDLSEEVRSLLPEILKSDIINEKKYESLRNTIELLSEQQKKLEELTASISESVLKGEGLSEDVFLTVKGYYEGWKTVSEIVSFLEWENEDGSKLSIDSIKERLKYTNSKTEIFNKAKLMLLKIMTAIKDYCGWAFAPFEILKTIDEDIEKAEAATVNSIDKVTEIIKIYQNLIAITDESELNDTVANSYNIISNHFEKLTPRLNGMLFMNKSSKELNIEDKSDIKEASRLLASLEAMPDNSENATPQGN